MDPLSQAQFDMVRRGSQAAVSQTRPILGTVKKVADALGYKLGRQTTSNVTRDTQGNILRTHVNVQQGFRTYGEQRDADNNVTRTSDTTTGIPGLFGNRPSATTVTLPARNRTIRTGQQGTPPTPGGPTGPGPLPFTPGPNGLRPNGGLNQRFWPNTQPSPTQPLNTPFHTPTQPQNLGSDAPTPPYGTPLPFNGAPRGRSDYGNPYGTP